MTKSPELLWVLSQHWQLWPVYEYIALVAVRANAGETRSVRSIGDAYSYIHAVSSILWVLNAPYEYMEGLERYPMGDLRRLAQPAPGA